MKKSMEKFGYCTSDEFKYDLKELCDKCPLKERLSKAMKGRIKPKIKNLKQVLSNEQFDDYVKKEVLKAQTEMDRMIDAEYRNRDNWKDPARKRRIEIYVWRKEQIKTLNELSLNTSKNQKKGDKKKSTSIFKEDQKPEGDKYLIGIDKTDTKAISHAYAILKYIKALNNNYPQPFMNYFNNLRGSTHNENEIHLSSRARRFNEKTHKEDIKSMRAKFRMTNV